MRILRLGVGLLVLIAFVPGFGTAASRVQAQPAAVSPIQGMRMLADLKALTDANWARTAGYDTNLPPRTNGHDEFLNAWQQLALDALHDLPVTVYRQNFAAPGFSQDNVDVPPRTPGTNVIVAVPGSQHPEQSVIIGCHPDGEPDSHGSAFDDASGCVIALGAARVLGDQWRRNGLPALTVQFDLFDAEEQGLGGSLAFLFGERHGALMPAPVFMINQEQSGTGYPVRPFGLTANDTLPLEVYTTPAVPALGLNNGIAVQIASEMGRFVTPQKGDLALALTRVASARDSAFGELRTAYSPIAYRDGTRDAFSVADTNKIDITQDFSLGSDNLPFEADGRATVTLSGDQMFYAQGKPDWAFPFDQPVDTFSALACDTGGSPAGSTAFAATLDLEGAMSVNLVNAYAPSISGTAGLTAFSGVPNPGAKTQFVAAGSGPFDWKFGDGGKAAGGTVTHTYKKPGKYAVTLSAGSARVSWHIKVPKKPQRFHAFQYGGVPPVIPWAPAALKSIDGCH